MFSFWLAFFPLVYGWDSDGLAAVGMTSMSGIRGDSLTQLKRLLGGKDIVDTSHWPSAVVHKYPTLAPLFEQVQDRDLKAAPVNCSHFNADENCPNGLCLVRGAQYFYALMINRKDLIPPYFQLPVNLKLTDTDNMKFLVALLAELHSVSRYGYLANNAGRELPVSYQDTNKVVHTNLYNYWDKDLVHKIIKDRPNFWYSGWTHYNSLGRPYFDSEQTVWNSKTAEQRMALFELWATDIFNASCTRVQRKQGNAAVLDASSEIELLVPSQFMNTAANIFMDFEFLKNKALVAGIRTSIVLNSILSNREAKKLRQGTGVNVHAG